jgi:hypothetical protein
MVVARGLNSRVHAFGSAVNVRRVSCVEQPSAGWLTAAHSDTSVGVSVPLGSAGGGRAGGHSLAQGMVVSGMSV